MYIPSLTVLSYIYAIILYLNVEFYTYHILISVTYDQLSYLLKVFFVLMVSSSIFIFSVIFSTNTRALHTTGSYQHFVSS